MEGSLLIHSIKELFQLRPRLNQPLRGSEVMGELPSLKNAYILIENGRITKVGEMSDCPTLSIPTIDATDRFVLPAFVDSHSHIVFAAPREEEFVYRIKGMSYEEIAKKGGGILNSARKLRNTSEDDLYQSARARLEEVIGFGTGALEIKSGYGLDFDSEIKMLRVIQRLKKDDLIPIKATFLGAHAVPLEYKNNRGEYIRLITEEMLPYVAEHQLADYCDVFCDRGFFTVDETDTILKRASAFGLKAKIHANELAVSGGVQVGIANNAISVDHLEAISQEEIDLLTNSSTIATLLPSTSFFLNLDYAPGRKLIDKGAAVVLASDYNPGSTPSGKMPFILSLACIKMKMTPQEAINAATVNAAFAIEMENEVGSISEGALAQLIITKAIPSIEFIPYAFGSDSIDQVIIKGKHWNA